jgi:hypothetical protein
MIGALETERSEWSSHKKNLCPDTKADKGNDRDE